MKLAWLTDTHLDFLDEKSLEVFLNDIKETASDAIAISGDIAEAHDVCRHLQRMETTWQRPVYFVLGSHDFYGGYIGRVRSAVNSLVASSQYLYYLSSSAVLPLNDKACIVGHDSWPDGRNGDYKNSPVVVDDFRRIKDLMPNPDNNLETSLLPGDQRLKHMQNLARQAVDHFSKVLPEAVKSFQRIILVTHVPPFREASWYRAKMSDNDYLPHFSCKTVGDLLLKVMLAHPDVRMTVLCGHTHGGGEVRILDNLYVLTGAANYGAPELQKILDIE